MSVENFCSRYPADPSVKGIVETIERSEVQHGKSSVVILAVQLAEEGQDGARKIIDKLNPSDTISEIDGEAFQRLSVTDRNSMFINYAGFVFGNSVVSLERALVNREYDHEEFCERYNLGTNSFQLPKVEATEKREKLPSEQLKKMRSLVKDDLTFSIFFEEKGIQALPNLLRQFLETTGTIPFIQKDIVPIYKPRANLLVAQKN